MESATKYVSEIFYKGMINFHLKNVLFQSSSKTMNCLIRIMTHQDLKGSELGRYPVKLIIHS